QADPAGPSNRPVWVAPAWSRSAHPPWADRIVIGQADPHLVVASQSPSPRAPECTQASHRCHASKRAGRSCRPQAEREGNARASTRALCGLRPQPRGSYQSASPTAWLARERPWLFTLAVLAGTCGRFTRVIVALGEDQAGPDA